MAGNGDCGLRCGWRCGYGRHADLRLEGVYVVKEILDFFAPFLFAIGTYVVMVVLMLWN